jgi:hypothetical protein
MPIPKPNSAEAQDEYVGRCMHAIGNEYDQEQALAICYATYEKENMSLNKFSEYRIKTQMHLAAKDAAERGINLAEDGGSYPWDECIADQTARYGDEETAKKVCGYIKSEYGS